MMRIGLFLLTNIAILMLASITLNLLGFNSIMAANGVDLNLNALLVFCAVFGMSGSLISLFLSKWLAKRGTGTRVIEQPRTREEQWLVQTVTELARDAGIKTPEIGIFPSPASNAFATGWNRNAALVAVSEGLLQRFRPEEARAVLAHEIGHVANGDMVTLTLIQGVVNTFVIFLSRIVGYAVDSFLRRGSDSSGPGVGYMVASLVSQVIFGVLASMIVAWFSRQREFRADAGAAQLMRSPVPMQNALRRLGNLHTEPLPQSMAASGIIDGPGFMALLATHPPLEARIAALGGH